MLHQTTEGPAPYRFLSGGNRFQTPQYRHAVQLLGSVLDSQNAAHGENSMNHPIVEDLVTTSHILANEGVLDGLGHISVRHPDNPQRYLMSRSLAPALVRRSDIMEYDLDSNALDRQG